MSQWITVADTGKALGRRFVSDETIVRLFAEANAAILTPPEGDNQIYNLIAMLAAAVEEIRERLEMVE